MILCVCWVSWFVFLWVNVLLHGCWFGVGCSVGFSCLVVVVGLLMLIRSLMVELLRMLVFVWWCLLLVVGVF